VRSLVAVRWHVACDGSDCVRVALVALATIACTPPSLPTKPLPPLEDPPNVMAPDTYTSKISGLRATLARSHVELDTEPVIKSCHGEDMKGCVTCQLASRLSTANVDPEMIDGVSIAFATYPSKVLEAAKLQHVALCRQIRQTGETGKDERSPAGVAIIDDHRLLVSIEDFVGVEHVYAYFTIEQVVHHELFHFLDYARLGDKIDTDTEWHALNAPDFAYRDPAPVADRPKGFVNSYATTNELEDRASTFEYLMGQPARLCEMAQTDPIVRAKTIVVWKRVAAVTGDSLLKQHARCVDWIGGGLKLAPRPPPKQPKAKPTFRLPSSPTSLVGKMR
jgi:hypothetical protein